MAAEAAPEVYHERQRFALCGLHSLNAMMQHDWQRFTGEEMEVIADTLFARERELGIAGFAATHCPGWLARRFFNPHKAGFGTGADKRGGERGREKERGSDPIDVVSTRVGRPPQGTTTWTR